MSYAEQQKQRILDSVTVPYQRVIIALGGDEARRICLFEGTTDLPFYGPLLQKYSEREGVVKPICLHGGTRRAVLGAREMLREKHSKSVRYIVDKDHSNYVQGQALPAEDLFVTKFYSVESYCIGLNEFTKLFSLLFSLEPDSTHIVELVSAYNASLGELIDALRRLHATVIRGKRLQHQCHMSNIHPSAVFRLTDGNIVLVEGGVDEAAEKLCLALGLPEGFYQAEQVAISEIEQQLRCAEPLDWLHGKYALSHLSTFLNYWYRHNKDRQDQYGQSPQIPVPINDKSLMVHSAHVHSELPELSAFLNNWLQS